MNGALAEDLRFSGYLTLQGRQLGWGRSLTVTVEANAVIVSAANSRAILFNMVFLLEDFSKMDHTLIIVDKQI